MLVKNKIYIVMEKFNLVSLSSEELSMIEGGCEFHWIGAVADGWNDFWGGFNDGYIKARAENPF